MSPYDRMSPYARQAAETALCRSALYEALAIGFRRPTPAGTSRIASPAGAAGLVAAAELLDATDLAPLVARLTLSDTDPEALERSYQRLFAHTVRSEVPAYETEYGNQDLFRQPQELADLGGFLAALGLTIAPGVAERIDHVSCECELAMFLARKEALARERGDREMLEETVRAQRLFLRDHLARFVPSLAERLRRADRGGFYAALGALAAAFVSHECARFEVSSGSVTLPLSESLDDNVPMACGGCELACGTDAADAD